jgi:transcription elongation GreA/GreB family factor
MKALKRKVIEALIGRFESELEAVTLSAKAAHEAATHEESKAEDAHDTRGLEASYLAGAQAARAAELKQVIVEYKALLENTDKAMESVAVGAFVRIQPLASEEDPRPKGAMIQAIVALRGGGVTLDLDGAVYSVITPSSPVGEALMGAVASDEFVVESKAGNRVYRLIHLD